MIFIKLRHTPGLAFHGITLDDQGNLQLAGLDEKNGQKVVVSVPSDMTAKLSVRLAEYQGLIPMTSAR